MILHVVCSHHQIHVHTMFSRVSECSHTIYHDGGGDEEDSRFIERIHHGVMICVFCFSEIASDRLPSHDGGGGRRRRCSSCICGPLYGAD